MIKQQELKHTEIGRIPKQWEVVRLGDRISLEYGKGLTEVQRKNGRYPVFGSNGIVGYHNSFLVKGPGIVVGRKGTIGAINWSEDNYWPIDTTYFVEVIGNDFDLRWLYYKLTSITLSKLNMATGTPGLNRDLVYSQVIPIPPLLEQKKIAEILSTVDQAIEKVDEAIEKTQRLKKGLMQTLLTKGIQKGKFKIQDFKDTEIGRIPKAWNVMKLGKTANVRYGLGQPPALETNGIPMIRATNVKRGRIVREGLIFINPSAIPNSRNPFLRAGDILVVRSGAYTGDVALVTKEWEGAVAGYDLIVTPSDTIDSKFLTYYLLSSSVQKRHFVGLKVRSAQPHLNSSQVEETPIPILPLPEQQKIAEILSTVDERLELLRTRKEKLEKIKKGLMNDLLTGKVRVTSLISEEVTMREIEEIKNELRENMPILRDKYKVKTIGLFGSYIRGEQSRGSDVDILVEFYETIDLFTFIELEEFLGEKVGVKVDLVMKDTLKPRIKDNILREAVTL